MLLIDAIEPGSIASELGLQPGDKLVAVNGEAVNDLVDYLIEEPNESLRIDIERRDGELWELDLEHDSNEPLGIVLPHPEPKQCGNNCIFCFVHQLPRGMRKTLYIKDEDYRFSYLYGAYVTLTNLSDDDLQHILRKQLSPLYISVHATEPELRSKLLGKSVPDVLPIMQILVDGGIELHTQVVVCPGLNDGIHLERTLADLTTMAKGIKSLAVVPVGLTGHRQKLPDLRVLTKTEAAVLVDWIELRQAELLSKFGTRFIFAADELYLRAGMEFPGLSVYEDLPQIENGVGLIPVFRMQATEVLAEAGQLSIPPVSLVTGVSAAGEVKAFAETLSTVCNIELKVHVIENHFFSGQVTVAGLLTGQDLLEQLANVDIGRVLLVPDVMLREGEDVFLDDVRVRDIADRLNVEVEVVPADPWGIWDMLETLNDEFSAIQDGER